MEKPLAGIKIVEVAQWAFVPIAGAMLADLGATVIKVEDHAGDPMRALTSAGSTQSWKLYNRGKHSIALDLKADGSLDVLHRLLDDADVFLTSMLPAARRKYGIDVEDIRSRHKDIVYAIGSALGAKGPEAEKGGYDAITFWSRGGPAAGVTPPDSPFPLSMPSGAFGDITSGSMLASGICIALLKRMRTGEGSIVDVSLLASSMWVMQRDISAAAAAGIDQLPKNERIGLANPLVASYRTADDRFVSLCMLQSDRWWEGFCNAILRPDLIEHERFSSHQLRGDNAEELVAILDATFASQPLTEWRKRLGNQRGPWEAVQTAGELKDDPQAIANGYVQDVICGDGDKQTIVSVPIQFDRNPMSSQRSPDLGEHSDEVLAQSGFSEEEIIDLKVAGIIW